MMTLPSIFISHGAPTIALEEDAFTRAVRRYGESLAGARGVAVVSAHWQTRGGFRVNAVARPGLIYDFGGFPDDLYHMRYDAAGDPALAGEIAALLGAELEEQRGWDHGVWIPLRILLPEANLPVVEISLPHPADPHALIDAGRKLAPLRDRGIVIVGSGGIVHNLRAIGPAMGTGQREPAPDAWAAEFDRWAFERFRARDLEALADYRRHPAAALAVPTPEHFEPLLVVAGSMRDDDEVVPIHEGMLYGNLSMRAFAVERRSGAAAS
jgi:4,5-DOPA dioxygenase extradiol